MKAQGKRFLTDRGDEGGSIRWHVGGEALPWHVEGHMDATLTITDCYKFIDLEFDCSKPAHLTKRIAKLDALIDELLLFKAALHAAQTAAKRPKFYY